MFNVFAVRIDRTSKYRLPYSMFSLEFYENLTCNDVIRGVYNIYFLYPDESSWLLTGKSAYQPKAPLSPVCAPKSTYSPKSGGLSAKRADGAKEAAPETS